MKKLALALALFVISGSPSLASSSNTTHSPAAKYIESLGNKALTVIQEKGASKDLKQKKLADLFADNVDFAWIGKFVMGRFWRQATNDQKSRYLKNYQDFLTKNYTQRFTDYTSGGFKVTGAQDNGKSEYTVSMEISSNHNEPPVLVDYKIRKAGAGFRVFDIIVEGVSMITTQRSEFASVLNQKGIDVLIEQLAVK